MIVIYCTKCKGIGHNRARCPQNQSEENAQNPNKIPPETPTEPAKQSTNQKRRILNKQVEHRKKIFCNCSFFNCSILYSNHVI